MTKPIHRAQAGDLVRKQGWFDYNRYPNAARPEGLFMVMKVLGPDECRGRAIFAHEMTLRWWPIGGEPNRFADVPMNLYEVV